MLHGGHWCGNTSLQVRSSIERSKNVLVRKESLVRRTLPGRAFERTGKPNFPYVHVLYVL